MIKTLSYTITTENIAVDVPGHTGYVYVYARNVGSDDYYTYVMSRTAYDKATHPNDVKNYEFVMPHMDKASGYRSRFLVVPSEVIDLIRAGDMNGWYKSDDEAYRLPFGSEIPDTHTVVGFSHADSTFCDINLRPINKLIRDTYLDRDYDIRAIVTNEADNDAVQIISRHNKDRDPIYYVPGNGYTLALGLRLSDAEYAEWLGLGFSYRRTALLERCTILGRYKKPETEQEDEED